MILKEVEIPICEGLKAHKLVEQHAFEWDEPRAKYVLFDENNNKISSKIYSGIKNNISEGLIAVSEGYSGNYTRPRWGFIDKTGKEIIECWYDFVGEFSEGLAVVGNGIGINCRYSYINTQGKKITGISESFMNARNFSEGYAAVKDHNGWGYINKEGHHVLSCRFDNAESFSNGKAKVCYKGKEYTVRINSNSSDDDSKFETFESLKAMILRDDEETLENSALQWSPEQISNKIIALKGKEEILKEAARQCNPTRIALIISIALEKYRFVHCCLLGEEDDYCSGSGSYRGTYDMGFGCCPYEIRKHGEDLLPFLLDLVVRDLPDNVRLFIDKTYGIDITAYLDGNPLNLPFNSHVTYCKG